MMTKSPQLSRLKSWFEGCSGALVAFSGGVDSSLVAKLAREFLGKERALAVISASPSLKLSDLDGAKAFCLSNDISLRVIRTQEMLNPNYFSNPENRCYYCKSTLYEEMDQLLAEFPGYVILNGTNRDDLGDYRPGLEAAKQKHVRSPLLECDLDKEAVREMALAFELSCWDKPASPCLSSRIPYGERVTEEKLRRIENAEAWFGDRGFTICRVRHVGEKACVEVPPDRIADLPSIKEIEMAMELFGFLGVEIDQEGFVSGKLNRALK